MDMLKVPSFFLHVLASLLILQLFHHNSAATTLAFPNKTYVNYIKTSCNLTTYPKLCYRSLSIFADQIKTNPKVLAGTALNVSLAATKTTSKLLNRLSKTQQAGMSPRDSAALRDCVELTDDSSYELERSLGEMRRLRSENFAFGISNIQTWASAALTNTVTCMDGFEEKAMDGDGDDHVKNIVLRRGGKVCRLTSNSLALVNSYASGQG